MRRPSILSHAHGRHKRCQLRASVDDHTTNRRAGSLSTGRDANHTHLASLRSGCPAVTRHRLASRCVRSSFDARPRKNRRFRHGLGRQCFDFDRRTVLNMNSDVRSATGRTEISATMVNRRPGPIAASVARFAVAIVPFGNVLGSAAVAAAALGHMIPEPTDQSTAVTIAATWTTAATRACSAITSAADSRSADNDRRVVAVGAHAEAKEPAAVALRSAGLAGVTGVTGRGEEQDGKRPQTSDDRRAHGNIPPMRLLFCYVPMYSR